MDISIALYFHIMINIVYLLAAKTGAYLCGRQISYRKWLKERRCSLVERQVS